MTLAAHRCSKVGLECILSCVFLFVLAGTTAVPVDGREMAPNVLLVEVKLSEGDSSSCTKAKAMENKYYRVQPSQVAAIQLHFFTSC